MHKLVKLNKNMFLYIHQYSQQTKPIYFIFILDPGFEKGFLIIIISQLLDMTYVLLFLLYFLTFYSFIYFFTLMVAANKRNEAINGSIDILFLLIHSKLEI